MNGRPDRPLVVKCTFDRWNKRILFASARNCSYELLRNKVEQCFSLYAAPYVIAYKDDDGEVTDITTDTDLTEAIQYFQAGSDDPPTSSAASILSGRSFGSRKITLRVHITVDYDGPSLSDTSSLASMEEYKGRSGSQLSFSFSSSSPPEIDDDSVTVSSRDTGALQASQPRIRAASSNMVESAQGRTARFDENYQSTAYSNQSRGYGEYSGSKEESSITERKTPNGVDNPFSDDHHAEAASRYPEDPMAVFERLKLEEEARDTVSNSDHAFSISANNRGAAWLRDQNARTIKSMLGATPEPSESDSMSLSYDHQPVPEPIDGDLALQRDPRGKYYYSYTSTSSSSASQIQDSGYDDSPSLKYRTSNPFSDAAPPRPTSMQLTWLASQQKPPKPPAPSEVASYPQTNGHAPRLLPHSSHSEPLPFTKHFLEEPDDIPPEVLQVIAFAGPPAEQLTNCSQCSAPLDAIRYVCSTCGEKKPMMHWQHHNYTKGKGKVLIDDVQSFIYPPVAHRTLSSTPSLSSHDGSSEGSSQGRQHYKPLPSLPQNANSSSSLTIHNGFAEPMVETGYELCSGCIESAGIIHALRGSLPPGENLSPSSPEDARVLSQWRRSAPKQKGQLRHAYVEKVWGSWGWEDVEQDDMQGCKCSTCNTAIINKRYQCASCQKFNLCRACFSQVHDIHPSHAFLVVSEKPSRSYSEPDYLPATTHHSLEERSMMHPGVKCAHCLQDIVGARFHCAICDSVDICSNCESAGLPGNLDSADGGHISSHIMIKIPYPLETTEVQTVSRRAVHLWTGRDAAHALSNPKSKSSSVYSSHARTVVGSGMRSPLGSPNGNTVDHHIFCSGCNTSISGIRYQCTTCPSSPTSYSLCASCEEMSYSLHDPMHIFFKLPRPVQRPLESTFPFLPKLYKMPAGPVGGLTNGTMPNDYLDSLLHAAALCDRCMEHIQGAWFRCAYCAKDLCGDCEALDTHDDKHIFMVFKAQVDMPHFRQIANLENPSDSPPIIPYAVYR